MLKGDFVPHVLELIWKGDCMSWLRTEESTRTQTLDLQNIAWMRKHLELCDTLHYGGLTSTSQPTRLLDLGDDGINKDFRLIDTTHGQAKQDFKYAALSYCWGPEEHAKNQLKTLTSNIQLHRNLIKFSTATPVVQDAVTTARALSMRYLWIDALCITQDDGADWAKESGKMGTTYTNAYVTFCTLTSTSCMEGFLTRPSAVNINFSSRRRPSVQGIYSLRHQSGTTGCEYGAVDIEENDFEHAGTWSKRAWTLQEQHLSKRRLYFGSSRIYLHCSEDEISEPRDYGKYQKGHHHNSFRDHVQHFKKDQDVRLLHQHWYKLVDGYLDRQITYRTDRLPALSGLARIMAVELGDTYLAGLWKNDLPRGLLWTRDWSNEDWSSLRNRLAPGKLKPYIAPSRSWDWTSYDEVYLAPSWSWACILGDAWYEPPYFTTNARIQGDFPGVDESKIETGFRSECIVIAAWCTPVYADVDEYGQIKEGELHIEGKLKTCSSTWKQFTRTVDAYGKWIAVGDDMSYAVCAMDFAVPDETPELQQENLHLLLLSSSCGDNSKWPHEFDYDYTQSISEYPFADSVEQTFSSSWEDEESEEEKDEGGDDVYASAVSEMEEHAEDSSSQGTGSTYYNDLSAAVRARQRNAWGLLVHPIAGTDKFIRVGVFRVPFHLGGLATFDDEPVTLVKLI
jgi:hypothetical protein